MVSGIGAIGNVGSNSSVSGVQALTPQTKAQLESFGIDTSNIKTEVQGQQALQSAQASQSSGSTQQSQQTQQPQQEQKSGGENSAFAALKSQALELASKVGASVVQTDKLNDIMSAISNTLSNMQAQAVNNPQKVAQVQAYQSEFQSLSNSISSAQSSQAGQNQVAGNQIQNSLNAMANYNIASISISNSNTGGIKH